MTEKISIAARLGGRGKKAGRVQANIRVLPETWAEVKRQAEARGITPGELIEQTFKNCLQIEECR